MGKSRIYRSCLLICTLFVFLYSHAQGVATPKGTPVSSINVGEQLTQYDKAMLNNYVLNSYPTVLILDEATTKYNCHAYAWWVSYGGSQVWINDPYQRLFWTDGSYLHASGNVEDGKTRVFYSRGDHSAVVSNGNYYVSKWGQGPLVKHRYNDCPYDYNNLSHFNICMNIEGDEIVQLPLNSGSATKTYHLNNVPSGANVTWNVNNGNQVISGQGTSTASISLTHNDVIHANVHCVSGIDYGLEFPVIVSNGPIITDIEMWQYSQGTGEYTFRVVTAQTDATFTWSCDYATEYPLPYPDDAIFSYPLNTYTAMRFHSTGNITVTVTGANAMGYSYTFAKTFYVPSSYD